MIRPILALTCISAAALFCGTLELSATGEIISPLSILQVIQQTLLPLSTREFWFPPCPLCWVVRAAIIATLAWWVVSIRARGIRQ